MELHALLQLELPDGSPIMLPGFGQQRLDACRPPGSRGERLEDVAANDVGVLRGLRVAGIERVRLGRQHHRDRPVSSAAPVRCAAPPRYVSADSRLRAPAIVRASCIAPPSHGQSFRPCRRTLVSARASDHRAPVSAAAPVPSLAGVKISFPADGVEHRLARAVALDVADDHVDRALRLVRQRSASCAA